MAFLVAALPWISAGVAVVGAIEQGKAATSAAAFNSAIQTQNAQLAREQARMEAAQTERTNFLRLGAIKASAGASGSTGEGSVLDVISDVARQGELQRQNDIFRGEAAARGFTNTGTLDVIQGRSASNAAQLRAGSELVSGIADAIRINRT